MTTNNKEADPSSGFKWLGDLLSERKSIGALATAIERRGIHGYDRFDRFKLVAVGSIEAQQVLDMLAELCRRRNDPQAEDDYADDSPVDNPFYRFGWPEDDCPDFEQLASEATPPPSPRNRGGRPRKDMELVAVLWAVVRGKLRCEPHPQFKSNSDLIKHILEKGGYDGTEQSTLERKFAEADRIIGATESEARQKSPRRS